MQRIDTPVDFRTVFGVSRETLGQLEIYADLLRKWQPAVNLVAPSTLGTLWHRHFADSAQLAALVPAGARTLADLGSGGGFPGLVLAIMLAGRQPPLAIKLIESDRRKCGFLREVARQTAISVEIVTARIENLGNQPKLDRIDLVTARAFAPLDRLLGLAAPLFSDSTLGLFLKGREVEGELTAARAKWQFEAELKPSITDPEARIVLIRNLGAQQEGRSLSGPSKSR